ncbi:MAG: DUF4879 domain-containing protein [Clostridium sp.]|nr:DUF4879 domain-containing protein [Clostridium sp.]
MKKITKIFSVFITVFLFASVVVLASSSEKASAAPAPKLTQFEVLGCSTPEIYNYQNGKTYISSENLSKGKLAGSTVYVVTRQMGYRRLSYSVDGGSYISATQIDKFPIQGYDCNGARAVVGWVSVESITGLSAGQHTIRALCNSTVVTGSMSDAVTVTMG